MFFSACLHANASPMLPWNLGERLQCGTVTFNYCIRKCDKLKFSVLAVKVNIPDFWHMNINDHKLQWQQSHSEDVSSLVNIHSDFNVGVGVGGGGIRLTGGSDRLLWNVPVCYKHTGDWMQQCWQLLCGPCCSRWLQTRAEGPKTTALHLGLIREVPRSESEQYVARKRLWLHTGSWDTWALLKRPALQM